MIEKRDRHGAVRCTCTVEQGGVRYAGTLYGSISSAALAAANDLGLKNKTQNGFIFWGIVKPTRPAGEPVAALEEAWQRYRSRAQALVDAGLDEAARTDAATLLGQHARAVQEIALALG